MMMNILHVVDMISQNRGGGSARVPYQLAAAQAKLGHEVSLYSSDLYADGLVPPTGVDMRLFNCWVNFMGGLRITPSMLFANFRKFDIIHLHNYRTLQNLIARGGGLTSMFAPPYVIQALGSCLPIRGVTKPVHQIIWSRYLLRHAQRCIALSDTELRQYLIEGAKLSQVVIADLGIDISEFEDLPLRHWKPYKTVLYLGKLHELKGPDLLIRAFALLDRDDVRLAMATWDDGYADKICYLVRALGIQDKVRWLGFLTPWQKKQTYVDADVCVIPSRYEAFGLGILEAAACGTPMVITDRCAISQSVPSYCADKVPFEDEAMAEAINVALDSNWADKDRDKRIAWARQYSWDRVAGDYINIYRAVLDGK